MVRPHKPIAEMTDAERKAFADGLFDAMAARHRASSDARQAATATR